MTTAPSAAPKTSASDKYSTSHPISTAPTTDAIPSSQTAEPSIDQTENPTHTKVILLCVVLLEPKSTTELIIKIASIFHYETFLRI